VESSNLKLEEKTK